MLITLTLFNVTMTRSMGASIPEVKDSQPRARYIMTHNLWGIIVDNLFIHVCRLQSTKMSFQLSV